MLIEMVTKNKYVPIQLKKLEHWKVWHVSNYVIQTSHIHEFFVVYIVVHDTQSLLLINVFGSFANHDHLSSRYEHQASSTLLQQRKI